MALLKFSIESASVEVSAIFKTLEEDEAGSRVLDSSRL